MTNLVQEVLNEMWYYTWLIHHSSVDWGSITEVAWTATTTTATGEMETVVNSTAKLHLTLWLGMEERVVQIWLRLEVEMT